MSHNKLSGASSSSFNHYETANGPLLNTYSNINLSNVKFSKGRNDPDITQLYKMDPNDYVRMRVDQQDFKEYVAPKTDPPKYRVMSTIGWKQQKKDIKRVFDIVKEENKEKLSPAHYEIPHPRSLSTTKQHKIYMKAKKTIFDDIYNAPERHRTPGVGAY